MHCVHYAVRAFCEHFGMRQPTVRVPSDMAHKLCHATFTDARVASTNGSRSCTPAASNLRSIKLAV